MKVLNSIQLKNGATTESNHFRPVTQPLQFLTKDKKSDDWIKQNADWFEMIGIRQVKSIGKGLLKNIRLAKGVIDRSDYIPEVDNEYSDVIEHLIDDGGEVSIDLKFFPLIPNVINILKAEFARRQSRIMYVGKDDTTYNEQLEEKRSHIEQFLLATEGQKMAEMLIGQGMDPESEQFQMEMDPGKLKSLPQIQQFFNKDYQSLIAEWATHQHHFDEKRFGMKEMEINAFESTLTVDREYWHFRMGENDYSLELWDPVFTWVVKSPSKEYVSNANAVGTFDWLTPADILNDYGYLLKEDQILSLERIATSRTGNNYILQGNQNDGTMYDSAKSYKWNTEGPSLGMRQFQSFFGDYISDQQSVDDLFNSDDLAFDKKNCLRVSTIYWMGQRKLYHLSKYTADGTFIQRIVSEDYVVTDNPVYNTKLFKERSKDSLVFGEHLDPLWHNQSFGVVKISHGSGGHRNAAYDFEPIYIGIDAEKGGPLKFQFKGDDSIWGCKLPVEGRIMSGRHTKSICPTDLMKPSQINYNLVNNQISDILIDEFGPVAMVDQNMLPKESLGEDWGPGNYVRAAEVMKRNKLLVLDTSTRNMEGTANFNQSGMLNFDESNRLMSRINLSRHFKEQGLEVIGITPQRMGQIQASESAQGTETATANSYAQTEMLFVQHSDWLMPRVHTMRTDLAQYYHSKRPSLRLQYVTSMDEKVNFQMNTTGMLSRDVGVYCTTDVNARQILQKMKDYFFATNTAGGNLHDFAEVLKADSLAEMTRVTKKAEDKVAAQKQAEYDNQQKMEQMRLDAEAKEKEALRAQESAENQLNRDNELQIALVRAAGMPTGDGDQNGEDDYITRLNYLQAGSHFDQKLDLDRQKENNKVNGDLRKDSLKREEITAKERIAQTNFQIARENQTRSELIAKKKLTTQGKK